MDDFHYLRNGLTDFDEIWHILENMLEYHNMCRLLVSFYRARSHGRQLVIQ